LGQILALRLRAQDSWGRVDIALGRGSFRALVPTNALLLVGGISGRRGRGHLCAPLEDGRTGSALGQLQLNCGPADEELLLAETLDYCGCHLNESVPTCELIANSHCECGDSRRAF